MTNLIAVAVFLVGAIIIAGLVQWKPRLGRWLGAGYVLLIIVGLAWATATGALFRSHPGPDDDVSRCDVNRFC